MSGQTPQQSDADVMQQMMRQMDLMRQALEASQARQSEMLHRQPRSQSGPSERAAAGFAASTGRFDRCAEPVKQPKSAAKAPCPLQGKEDWEKFVFQTETFLVLIDPDYPDRMDAARRSTEPLDPEDMTDEARRMLQR